MEDAISYLNEIHVKRIAIYDPKRVPKHWVEMLRPGQFAVFLHDAYTSVILNENGVAESGQECCYVFESLAEAKAFSDALVERNERVRCEIFDERGLAVEPLYTVVNKRLEHRVGSRKTAHLLMLGGGVSAALSIPLFWYDWLSRGVRIWPTIIGINLFFLGLRLLHWGYSSLEKLRRQERYLGEREAELRIRSGATD